MAPLPMLSHSETHRQLENWMETAKQYARGEEYYRGLLDEIGNIIGDEAFICDDGSRSDSVLRAKLPELVKKLRVSG